MFEIKSSLFMFFQGHYIISSPYHVPLHSQNVLLLAESTSNDKLI